MRARAVSGAGKDASAGCVAVCGSGGVAHVWRRGEARWRAGGNMVRMRVGSEARPWRAQELWSAQGR